MKIQDLEPPFLLFVFDAPVIEGLVVEYVYLRSGRRKSETYRFGLTDEKGTWVWRTVDEESLLGEGVPKLYTRTHVDGDDAVDKIIIATAASRYAPLYSMVDGELIEGVPDDAVRRIHRLVLENDRLFLAQK